MPHLVPTPSPASSATCEPCSTILPFSITTMRSQLRTVLNLCATKMAVRPSATSSSDCKMPRSVAVSSADVASSASNRRGDRRKARAIATRCFSPPLSFTPRSPTIVIKPSGISASVRSSLASAADFITSSTVASTRPYRRLWSKESLNSTVSCGTMAMLARRDCILRSRMSIPSTSMEPSVTSYARSSRRRSVLLPLPDGPTIPTDCPSLISRLTSSTTRRVSV
mmetsp:Transcript_13258/g.32190  ORF Transcript_13258/g.32190 Transcript_13258/m.32190 type:complete len:225 (+) Transcript_13258:565-1239(+)